MFEDFSFCTECEHYDRNDRLCKLFDRTMVAGCPYGEERKPMLDLDALEVGFYAKGRDGNFYKVDLPVDFPFTKTINVMTGEVHYPNNYGRLKSMSMEEMAAFIAKFYGCSHCPGFNVPCDNRCKEYWLDWLKEEVE